MNKNTPIETYSVDGKEFDVKREDLCFPDPYPKLAKLRGVYNYLESLKAQGVETVGVFDTRVSHAGWGVSACCKDLDLKCHCYYPILKEDIGKPLHAQQQKCKDLGAQIVPLPAGRTQVLYYQAKNLCKIGGGTMLPLGLVALETLMNVKKEVEQTEGLEKYQSLVISVGTGTILSGVLAGLKGKIPYIYAVSAGMNSKNQRQRIEKLFCQYHMKTDEPLNHSWINRVQFFPSGDNYYDAEECDCPFPAHKYYDRKAYKWMIERLDKLPKPVLFWNIGSD